MQRTVGAIPCRPQLERKDKSGGLAEKAGGHAADGSGTEVLIMHDGLFWLSVKSVTVRASGPEVAFFLPALIVCSSLCVFLLSDLYCVHSDLESRRALKVAFSPQILVSKRNEAHPSTGSLRGGSPQRGRTHLGTPLSLSACSTSMSSLSKSTMMMLKLSSLVCRWRFSMSEMNCCTQRAWFFTNRPEIQTGNELYLTVCVDDVPL